jgi:hypothetical protein
MILTAQEVNRSFRGALDLFNNRIEGLQAFDMSERGFWRSFGAIWLTLPAYIVTVAAERVRLGLSDADQGLLGSLGTDLVVALAYGLSFIALPVAMIWITRRLDLTDRFVPFVIVNNWVTAIGLLVLSLPALLQLIGWATPALASIFGLAFAVVFLRLQWIATKATLGLPGVPAFGIVALGVVLNMLIGVGMRGLLS